MSEPATNAFYLWKVSPLTLLAPSGISFELFERVLNSLILFSGLIFFLLFLPRVSAKGTALRVLMAVLGTFFVLQVLSGDRVALSSIAWLPWLLGAVENNRRQRTLLRGSLPLIACGILVALSANQLTPLVLGASLLIHVVLKEFFAAQDSSRENSPCVHVPPLALFIALSAAALYSVPEFAIPWYPQGSQVVPDDEIPGMLRPFVGPLPPIPFIHRLAVKDFFVPTFQLLIVAVALSALAYHRRGRERSAVMLLGGMPLVLLFVDLRMPEQLSIISPLLVIPRLLPHLFFFPLENLALGIGALGLIFSLLLRTSYISPGIVGALCLVQPLVFPLPSQMSPEQQSASRSGWSSSERYERHLELLSSPSQFLLSAMKWDALGKNRNWLLERENLIRTAKFKTLSPEEVAISASHESDMIPQLFSKRDDARWTPGQGSQQGDEWLLLRFPTEQELDGIELFLGPYVTDFPRGLRISQAPGCEVPPSHSSFSEVLNIPTWLGGIEFTPQGRPYFKGRYSMKVYFPKTITANCLLLEQTGSSAGTDWSVSEIRVLPPDPGSAD
jgi:hypothetical protein